MKVIVAILALAIAASALPVENRRDEINSIKLVPVENLESVQNSQNMDVLIVEENNDGTSISRNKRFIIIDALVLAKAGLIGLGGIKLKEMFNAKSTGVYGSSRWESKR